MRIIRNGVMNGVRRSDTFMLEGENIFHEFIFV